MIKTMINKAKAAHRRLSQGGEAGISGVMFSLFILISGLVFMQQTEAQILQLGDTRAERGNSELRTIQTAIEAYLLENRHLPCPARMFVAGMTEAEKGISNADACLSTATFGTVNGVMLQFDIPNGLLQVTGTLPYKTLGLPEEFGFDEHGNHYTYVASWPSTLQDNPAASGQPGWLRIRDIHGNDILPPTDLATYVVFSPGKDKRSIHVNDTILYCWGNAPTDVNLDGENCDSDGIFVQAAATRTAVGTEGHYDDHLIYGTR